MVVERVIFDADLTLIDSFGGVHETYCLCARKLGLIEPSKDDLRGQWGKKIPDILAGLFGEDQRDSVYGVLEAVSAGFEHQLFAGVAAALREISGRGLPLGILSTTEKRFFRPHLEKAGVFGLFDLVVGGEDTEFRKPDPSVFAAFLKNHKPKQLVYVGDALVDWEASRDAGLGLFLAVTTGLTSKENFLAAGVPEVHVLDSVANVPKALNMVD